jgi:4-carboxymuconolactone decarboxylase
MSATPARSPRREHLQRSAPGVHDGPLRVRSVTDRDGALDAGFKALAMAAAAAAQRDGALAAHELERAAELRAGAERAWAVGAVLLSSRGEGAYARFADAAHACFGAPQEAPAPSPPPDGSGEQQEAESFLAGASGSLPPYAPPLRDHAPAALVGYARAIEAAWGQPALTADEVQLVLVCVNVATLQPAFAAHHSRLARAAGASDAQVVEAGVCAIPSGGVTAWYAAGARLLDS